MKNKRFSIFELFLFLILLLVKNNNANVDMVIFSYDRPMQLYALLESIEKYVTGLDAIKIVYRSTDESYEHAYQKVKNRFNKSDFYRQGKHPHADFKLLTEHAAFNSLTEYIIFAVDDNIVKDYVNLAYCAECLERYDAYGFYLRLGKNLSECYMLRCAQPLPKLRLMEQDVYLWTFDTGLYDWQYPNTVDMTLYRKKDIAHIIKSLNYHSPNTLEARWHSHYHSVVRLKGLCFELSKIINVPMNLVQQDYTSNRHMEEIPALQLLLSFNNGLKIDIEPFYKTYNKSAHIECIPTYIYRND